MSSNKPELVEMVKNSRVIVCLGSGGVGKTTSSAALAVLGAQLGKKVGLLSIDPAKRLADALGIRLGSELSKVTLDDVDGELYGAMLDQKSVFDEMVRRYTPSKKIQERIFANSIYREVSANLGGPLEYMALAKLHNMVSDESFDLIVLDTPPDTHALDFLMRPNILAGFMEKKVMTWLIKPFHLAQRLGAGKLLRAGGRLMNGIASITGVKMLQMLSEFLVLMEDVIKGFNQVGERIARILREPSTKFVLVAAPHNAAVRSANNLIKELSANAYPLGALIVNRCPSEQIQQSLLAWSTKKEQFSAYEPGLEVLSRAMIRYEQIAANLKQSVDDKFGSTTIKIRVEEQKRLIHSLQSLTDFAQTVANSSVL